MSMFGVTHGAATLFITGMNVPLKTEILQKTAVKTDTASIFMIMMQMNRATPAVISALRDSLNSPVTSMFGMTHGAATQLIIGTTVPLQTAVLQKTAARAATQRTVTANG